jgi:adenosylmethionine-8-amino-7-oxononanoate aminotransferase
MKASMVKRALAVGLAGALISLSAVGAIAKVHKGHKSDKYTVTVASRSYASVPVETAAAPAKICWRYHGGPKGGMSPGPCP